MQLVQWKSQDVKNQKTDLCVSLNGHFLSSFMQHESVTSPLVRMKGIVRQGKVLKRWCFGSREKQY